MLGVEALQGDDDCIGLKVNTADGYADYLFSVTDMQAHHPSGHVSFCGSLGVIREKEGKLQLMYLGCGRSLKKGNFVLESDRDVYAAIYMRHGVWYYSATGPVRVKMGKETKDLDEGYNQKLYFFCASLFTAGIFSMSLCGELFFYWYILFFLSLSEFSGSSVLPI